MTVAVVVKVFDGLVLAADSATTLPLPGGSAQVWNHANKVFHLHRKHPIGAMTWGTGSIGSASVETLAKDFRHTLMSPGPGSLPDDYTVEYVARRFAEELHELHGDAEQPGVGPGLLVAGYNGDSTTAEAWQIQVNSTDAEPTVELVIPDDAYGWLSFAQTEATLRLFQGFDPELPVQIRAALDDEEWDKIAGLFNGPFNRLPLAPPMPFADAIDLAQFLVSTTVGYSRYLMGPDTVGGPTEVAGITRHEGFKWVRRKHYYGRDLNPRELDHAD